MPIEPAATWLTLMSMLLLVVSTGTAWFTALHPGFIWRIMRKETISDEEDGFQRSLRFGGILFGTAGLLLLRLSDLWSY